MHSIDQRAYDKGRQDAWLSKAFDPVWNYQPSEREAYEKGFTDQRNGV